MMEVLHPRRLLILSSPDIDIAPIINTLVPPPSSTTDVDSPLESPKKDPQPYYHIQTPYYNARVPIWIDRVESSTAWSEEWKEVDGAGEVVGAIGAWVVVFEKPASLASQNIVKETLKNLASVVSHHSSSSSYETGIDASDTVMLAVALSSSTASCVAFDMNEWEDTCRECGGWELIDSEANGEKNEYGERTGLQRVHEALQSGEWDSGLPELDAELDIEDEPASGDDEKSTVLSKVHAADENGFLSHERGFTDQEEILAPILSENSTTEDDREIHEERDEDVEQLQRMMIRMQAARDMGADLPASERKRLAAKAVKEVMRDM